MKCLNQYCDAEDIEKDDNFCYKCGHWTSKGFSFIKKEENVIQIMKGDAAKKDNNFFVNKIGFHNKIYKLTEILGIIPIIIVLIYAIIGLHSLIEEKSFKKVNKNLYYLAIFYIIVLGIYFLFEKVIINFRPVVIEGILESSYPSSHTILAICICGSSIILNNSIFKNNKIAKFENIISFIIIIMLPLLRFISGVHWFTDIIGGILLSLSLLLFFKYFVDCKK